MLLFCKKLDRKKCVQSTPDLLHLTPKKINFRGGMPPDPPKKLGRYASSVARCARCHAQKVALCFKSFSKVALSNISLPRPGLGHFYVVAALYTVLRIFTLVVF